MNALEKAKEKETQYIKCIRGYRNLKEADDNYNDISRKIIKAYKKTFGTCYLGKFYSKDILTEYTGQEIYNFACEFIVPKNDEELKQLLSNDFPKNFDKVYTHIKSLKGELIKWV